MAANQVLRAEMVRRLSGLVPNKIIFTAPELCTDNAAMVASLGVFHAALGESISPLELEVKPSLSMRDSRW